MAKNRTDSNEAAAGDTPAQAASTTAGVVTFADLVELREAVRKEMTEAIEALTRRMDDRVDGLATLIKGIRPASPAEMPLVKYMIGPDEERLAIISRVECADSGRCTLLVIKAHSTDLVGHPHLIAGNGAIHGAALVAGVEFDPKGEPGTFRGI